jgi:transposase/HAMP domain-containing protein
LDLARRHHDEESQPTVIKQRTADLMETLGRLKTVANDKSLSAAIDRLTADETAFVGLSGETLQSEAIKKENVTKALAVSSQGVDLLNTAGEVATKLTDEAGAAASGELSEANRIGFMASVMVMLALAGSVAFTFMGLARPLTRLNGALGRMAAGELNIDIPGASRGDEVGDIAKTVVVIRENAEQKARAEAEAQAQQEQIAARQRKADMVRLADSFEAAVGEIVETVASAATELEASASTLTSAAARSQEVTVMVAAASKEASTNVQSVASATEELSSSVNEISRQVQTSARMAGEAVDQARNTNGRVAELSKAAARIGDVVELINTIAGQTNLDLGHSCTVAAPTLIARKPGHRIKTDRRDSQKLALQHRFGDLTEVWVPDPVHEAIRDLVRARMDAVMRLMRARQQCLAFLLRHGRTYGTGKKNWTLRHRRWLATQEFDQTTHQIVFQDYVEAVWSAQDRRDQLEARISAMLSDWSMAPLVEALRTVRGIDLISSVVFVAAVGDLGRFESPRQLMAHLGLVPSEQSSGSRIRRGGITRVGNREARRMLVEAAWSYRYQPRVSSGKTDVVERQPKPVRDGRRRFVSAAALASSWLPARSPQWSSRDRSRAQRLRVGHRSDCEVADARGVNPPTCSAGGEAQGQAILESPVGRFNPIPVLSQR